ncbi:glycosyltransferase [Fibrella aquatica]|uniref:glycosyltransferase n=1 Tax=Fibrella aquatica TaxID=3242487 RepID=UPI0035225416
MNSLSMPRYVVMLSNKLKERGFNVEIWSPEAKFYNIFKHHWLKKWMGYIDQYIVFPSQIRKRANSVSSQSIFVFTDHAQGPWVTLLNEYPHVIHCHDFLAQQSALGEVLENPTSLSGRLYQAYIRRGFRRGKNFISVSAKTRSDLHRFLNFTPDISEIVYNSVNTVFEQRDILLSRETLSVKFDIDFRKGYILHVGGNQWYKNRRGVIEIYSFWREKYQNALPLIMIGQKPNNDLLLVVQNSVYKKDIYFLTNLDDDHVVDAYAGASVFLFPSLAEGFGWPIAEAMTTGCPVITTNEAPMTEVAGNAALLIPKRPHQEDQLMSWLSITSGVLNDSVSFTSEQRKKIVEAGIENARRFSSVESISELVSIYTKIYATQSN